MARLMRKPSFDVVILSPWIFDDDFWSTKNFITMAWKVRWPCSVMFLTSSVPLDASQGSPSWNQLFDWRVIHDLVSRVWANGFWTMISDRRKFFLTMASKVSWLCSVMFLTSSVPPDASQGSPSWDWWLDCREIRALVSWSWALGFFMAISGRRKFS
jgi:hypothetical protein